MDIQQLNIGGLEVDYYCICKRKLWLYSNGISMETTSDRVIQGTVLHENSYNSSNSKEVLINNMICLDIVDNDYVREVKISSKMKNADKMQLLYYLYVLKNMGIEKKGTLNYTKEKKVEEVILGKEEEKAIEEILDGIEKVLKMKYPPKAKKYPYCSKCSYYEYCYICEEDE